MEEAPAEYSWWGRDAKSEVDAACQELESFISAARRRYLLQDGKLIGCGFSQGAALLALLLQRRPALLDGAVLLCGYVVQEPKTAVLTGVPVLVIHGMRDDVVPLQAARQGVLHLQQCGADVALITDNTGHKVGRTGMEALRRWLADTCRPQ